MTLVVAKLAIARLWEFRRANYDADAALSLELCTFLAKLLSLPLPLLYLSLPILLQLVYELSSMASASSGPLAS